VLEVHSQLFQNVLGIREHVHQMRNRRTLISGHIRNSGLQKSLRDSKNSLALEFLALPQIEFLDFLFEGPFRHRLSLCS